MPKNGIFAFKKLLSSQFVLKRIPAALVYARDKAKKELFINFLCIAHFIGNRTRPRLYNPDQSSIDAISIGYFIHLSDDIYQTQIASVGDIPGASFTPAAALSNKRTM